MKLFTTSTCTQCPIVIGALNGSAIEYELINAEESPDQAAEHGIMSVPTIVDEVGNTHVGTSACLAYINR